MEVLKGDKFHFRCSFLIKCHFKFEHVSGSVSCCESADEGVRILIRSKCDII